VDGVATKSDRARGRELALLALCHLDSYGSDERVQALELLWRSPPDGPECELAHLIAAEPIRGFAERLLAYVSDALEDLDALIESTSRSWRLERMDRIDRNLVRLAAAELSHEPETPRAVVLAEAVRLAARYGSEHSARFVNGLVEALAHVLRPPVAEVGEGTHEHG
jgi:N utilization substance protein B